jgi:hypothetical protein
MGGVFGLLVYPVAVSLLLLRPYKKNYKNTIFRLKSFPLTPYAKLSPLSLSIQKQSAICSTGL